MKRWTSFFFITLLLSLPITVSAEELGGGYSVEPPAGWKVSDFRGSPYKGLYGTRVNDFTPNINIQEDNYNGPMDTYVQLSYMQVKKLMNAKKVSEGPFLAKSHKGVKLIADTEFNNLQLTQTFYFFENPNGKKVVVVATSRRDSGREYDPVFDGIMTTFNME